MDETQINNFIREKCIAANPSILDLVMGCKVRIFGCKIRTVLGVENYGNKKGKYIRVDRYGDTEFEPSEYTIIGRDITALDILKILPYGWMIKEDKGTGNFEFVDMDGREKKNWRNDYFIWYGSIEKISLKSKQFIYNLIK